MFKYLRLIFEGNAWGNIYIRKGSGSSVVLAFSWTSIFILILVVLVLVVLSIFQKITAPIRIALTILSFGGLVFFLWKTGLVFFALEKILFMGQKTADLFSILFNLILGRALSGG